MTWHLKHEIHGDKPWAVQAEAIKRAGGRERYGYFLEQGLGKTALTLNDFVSSDDTDLNIVLAPSSFKADWPLAPQEWGCGFLRTGMWPDDELPFDWDNGLYSIAHETLRGSQRARDGLLDLFKQRACFLTFDESTGIKNPSSLLAKYTVQLAKEAVRVRELNGTPLVQNVEDYYAPLQVLGAMNGVNRYAFRNRFAAMGGFMGKQILGIRPEREEELARLLDSVSFRALKKDWRKDLPPQLEIPVHLKMTDNQRKHYYSMMEEFYVETANSNFITADMVLTQRQKLMQIASCMIMDKGKVHWIEEPKNNPKLNAIKDLFDHGIGKAIIVYFFDPSGRMLIDEMRKAGLEPAWITGGMKAKDIVEQKRRFNDDTSCRVLVGQQDQTSRGHTLLGQAGNDRCNRMFYYENSLSLMHRLQMNDRNHRGSQDQTCCIYDLITSPIDQINVDILTKKKNMADGMDALLKEIRKFKR